MKHSFKQTELLKRCHTKTDKKDGVYYEQQENTAKDWKVFRSFFEECQH